jgi:membrane protease YdiL (CAAX protease family)
MTRSRRMRAQVRLWALLTEASVVTSVAALPYVLELQKDALETANAKRREAGKRVLGPGVLAGLAAVQAHLTFAPVVAVGLKLGRQLGLGAPYLESWLAGKPRRLQPEAIGRYALAGLGAAAVVAALDARLFGGVRADLARRGVRQPAAWRGLLATTYGSVAEEVLLRLGVQTALAAGLVRLTGDTGRRAQARTMVPAIAGSGLLFGVAHLPAARSVGLKGRAAVTRTLVLNGVPGAVFGTIYWKRGLEAAMIAHAATALTLTVGLPALERAARAARSEEPAQS